MSLQVYENAVKKSMHISMPGGTHKHFKAMTAARGLSMQEVFEEFATRCVEEQKMMIQLLDDMAAAKRRGESLKRLVKNESDNFYEILEAEDPFDL